jgi:hypothetical protein
VAERAFCPARAPLAVDLRVRVGFGGINVYGGGRLDPDGGRRRRAIVTLYVRLTVALQCVTHEPDGYDRVEERTEHGPPDPL